MGRADVSVRGGWAAGNAVGGHRTLNKTDSPFVPVSHRALAVRTGTRRLLREMLTSRQRGSAMKPELGTFAIGR